MAYTVNTGAVMEVTFRGLLHGQRCINVFHYEHQAGPTIDGGASLDEMLGLIETDNHVVNYLAMLSHDYDTLRTRAQWVYPQRFAYRERTPGFTVGSVVEDSSPSGASSVIRRKGDTAGPMFRGRIFVPALAVGRTAASELTGAQLTAMDVFAAAFIDSSIALPGTGGDMLPIIWTLANSGIKTPVTDYQLDPIVRYQRRREVHVGE